MSTLIGENMALDNESKNIPDIGQGEVFRQLPVGLFDSKTKKKVFTCGHSAIDLWNRNGDTINIVELKFRQHKIGIITEIFFLYKLHF